MGVMYCIYPASGPWLEHPLVEQVTSNNIETKTQQGKDNKGVARGFFSPSNAMPLLLQAPHLPSHWPARSSFDEGFEARSIREERQGTRKQARKPQKERRGMTYRAGDARAHA